MQNIVKLPVIPWICFVDVPFHCSLLSVKKANHKQQNKMVLLKIHHLTSPNHSDLGRNAGRDSFYLQEILWKSTLLGCIGCSLCWKLLWQLKSFKVENNETRDSSSMELPLFFSQGGKGSAWLWSYSFPSTWFSVCVHAVSCLETWLSFLVFLKYFPFEKICRWR